MLEARAEKCRRWKIFFIPIIFAIVGAILFPFFQQLIEINRSSYQDIVARPKYILYDGLNITILDAVDRVLERLGLEKINITGLKPLEFPTNFNVLWTYRYIDPKIFKSIKFHQKINHFPGNYVLASKSYLSTRNDFDFIPKGFMKSEDVQVYATQHPNKRFVIKLKSNRGVKLVKPSEMNFTITWSSDGYFSQEYIEDPLLWNGHKFDFSIFVAITSVHPLRFYYYNKNVNLRFCLKPYDTSNASDVDSYVIGTEHIAGQSFDYVKKYIDAGYTYRDAFEGFIREIGGNVDEIWQKVENVIRSVVLTKEEAIIDAVNRLEVSKFSFFELFRFDMIFDKNLKLHLIEVNMSPNLVATAKKFHNKFMFENVLYNLFNLIGIGSSYKKSNIEFPDYQVESMITYHDALTVKPEDCLSTACLEDCSNKVCEFCWNCVNKTLRYEMITTFNEQMNRGHFKRLFPVDKENISENLWLKMSDKNKFFISWFQEMCKKNEHFC